MLSPTRPWLVRTVLTLLVTAAVGVSTSAAVLVPLPADSQATVLTDRLLSGQTLRPGEHRDIGTHRLVVQLDGDVRLLEGATTRWSTGTAGHPGARLVMQEHGALEVLSPEDVVLWSNRVSSPGARLVVKPDGYLYGISVAHTVIWSTQAKHAVGEVAPTDRIASGGMLVSGGAISTADGSHELRMQADGDLVLWAGARAVWRSGTRDNPGAALHLETTGELRVVAPGGATLWSNGVSSPGARLVIKGDGRIYEIDRAGASVWSTTTGGGTTTPVVVPDADPVPSPTATPAPVPSARPTPTATPGTGRGDIPIAINPGFPFRGGDRPATGTDGPRQPPGPGTPSSPARSYLATRSPYVSPTTPAAVGATAARSQGRTADAALLDRAAAGGAARWLTPVDRTTTVARTVREYAAEAAAAGRTPVFVTYAIPDRDCGNQSAGGLTPAQYTAWTQAVAAGLAGARAVVVVEPDALLHVYRCGDSEARFDQIRDSARAYTAAGAEVYLDAGSSNSFNWGPATRADIASRLERAGIREVAGFATNVSNFQTTADERAYGDALSPLVGGARYVIDTSRNGQGGLRDANGAVWCNPPGRGLGTTPAYVGSGAHAANLWIKTVGLSDGQCNGGPPAGRFWEEYALGLALRSAS